LGPGTYDRNEDLTRARSPSVKISKTERKSLNKSVSTLGPGSYYYEWENKGPMMTIGEKRESKHEKSIGPGHYEVEQAI
jgi:hypothetical protein